MELNKVLIIGNLTRDPETKTLSGDSQVCKFSLAANRRYTSNGKKGEEVLFVDVETWGKTAELCGKFLSKGSGALIEGRLKMETWESKEGEKRSKLIIVADRVQFAPKRDGQSSGDDNASAPKPSAGGWDKGGSDEEEDDLGF